MVVNVGLLGFPSTGKAVIDMATARNSTKLVKGTSRLESRGYNTSASTEPKRKGRRILACEVATSECARPLMSPAFRSRPTMNM